MIVHDVETNATAGKIYISETTFEKLQDEHKEKYSFGNAQVCPTQIKAKQILIYPVQDTDYIDSKQFIEMDGSKVN